MSSVPLPYRLAVRLVRLLAPLVSFGGSKLSRGVIGRRRAHERLEQWGRHGRDPERATIWFHAPSVGEGLQARAVAHALLAERPDMQVVFTYFSPSAVEFARSFPAVVTDYLPWDVRLPVTQALDAVEPDLLVFTKTEVWPVLVEEACERDVPVAFVGGAVAVGAGRLRWPARKLLRGTWARLSLACANSDADAEGLATLGVCRGILEVTGDPGIDSAVVRAGSADHSAPYLAPFHREPRVTIVAGSTWPSDEAVLFPALEAILPAIKGLRLIIAPHEPHQSHVRALSDELTRRGFEPVTLAQVEAGGELGTKNAVVVDRVGVLAHLYTVGTVGYVGGGFHDAGLHSVLEPAAAGIPVVFGPGHQNARAAGELIAAGGASSVNDSNELSKVLLSWLGDAETLNYAGSRAERYIDAHRGAAARTAALLQTLLRTRS